MARRLAQRNGKRRVLHSVQLHLRVCGRSAGHVLPHDCVPHDAVSNVYADRHADSLARPRDGGPNGLSHQAADDAIPIALTNAAADCFPHRKPHALTKRHTNVFPHRLSLSFTHGESGNGLSHARAHQFAHQVPHRVAHDRAVPATNDVAVSGPHARAQLRPQRVSPAGMHVLHASTNRVRRVRVHARARRLLRQHAAVPHVSALHGRDDAANVRRRACTLVICI